MNLEFLIQLLLTYRYAIIAPAVFIIGAPVSLVAGILLRLEVLEIVPTCLMLAVGELTADVLWYWLGIRYGDSFVKRNGRYGGMRRTPIAYTKELFERHHDIIIFTSKITAGLGFGTVIMFTAGLSRVPFRRYMMLNIAGQFLWTASLLSIGYFLGHLFIDVSNVFEKMALFALAIIILISIIGFGRYLRTFFNISA